MFRHWVLKIDTPTLVPEYKVSTLSVPEFWGGSLKNGVFTLVPSDNRARAPSVNMAYECFGVQRHQDRKGFERVVVNYQLLLAV